MALATAIDEGFAAGRALYATISTETDTFTFGADNWGHLLGIAARLVLEGDDTAGAIIREFQLERERVTVNGRVLPIKRVTGVFVDPGGVYPGEEADLRRDIGQTADLEFVSLPELFPEFTADPQEASPLLN